MGWNYIDPLPYAFSSGSIVVLNNEIHILGGYDSQTWHYKFSNGQWTSVSTLPYNFYYGDAIVLNDEIHILGGSSGSGTKHYKYSNGEWVSVSTLPYNFYHGCAVVLDGEIHILGSGDSNYLCAHYKYYNGEWVSVSALPYDFYYGSAVVLNDEIHILGGISSSISKRAHRKYSNGEWVSVSALPYDFCDGSTIVLNDEIHIFGGREGVTNHYKYSNGQWVSVSTLPYELTDDSAIVLNNKIYLLGGSSNNASYIFSRNFYEYQSEKKPNKIIFGNSDILDLTNDTITQNDLLANIIAHDAAGNRIGGNIRIREVSLNDNYTSYTSLSINGFYKPTASAYMIKKYYSKTPTAAGVAFDAGFNKMSAGGVAYTQRPCGRVLFGFTISASRTTSWTPYEFASTAYEADGTATATVLDPWFGHIDANGDIVVDRAISAAYLAGGAMRGVTSSGTAVYCGIRLLKNGTVIHSVYGSSTTASPTFRRIETSFAVGDVIQIQSRCSTTTQGYAKAYINITWAGT